MNEPHLRSATAVGVIPAVAVDRLKTARREWHERTYYGQITEVYVRWLGFYRLRSRLHSRLQSRRNLPAFIFHFAVRPVLQLLEQSGFNHDKSQARSSSGLGPYQPAFRLDHDFAIW